MPKYAKSEDGVVHLISAINSEFTLCGDAFDGINVGAVVENAWVAVDRGPITCVKCIAEIKSCKSVRLYGSQKHRR